MPKIIIYSTPMCGVCRTLKMYLKSKGFEYQDIDVSEDILKQEEMIEKSEQMTVPVTEIDGKIFIGFNMREINKALNIKEDEQKEN